MTTITQGQARLRKQARQADVRTERGVGVGIIETGYRREVCQTIDGKPGSGVSRHHAILHDHSCTACEQQSAERRRAKRWRFDRRRAWHRLSCVWTLQHPFYPGGPAQRNNRSDHWIWTKPLLVQMAQALQWAELRFPYCCCRCCLPWLPAWPPFLRWQTLPHHP